MSALAMMSPPLGMHDQLMMPNPALMPNGFPHALPPPQFRRAIPGSPFDFPSPMGLPVYTGRRMTGNYGPAAAGAAVLACDNYYDRTIYIGNVPAEASLDELLNLVHFGPIENIKMVPESRCVFISFLNGSVAAAFVADAQVKRIAVKGIELRVNWAARQPPLGDKIAEAVMKNDACRAVYIPNVTPEVTEEMLSEEFSQYGIIDQIKTVRNQENGFVHYTSIQTAMQVVEAYRKSGKFSGNGKQVGYGKDRCAFVPKAQKHHVEAAMKQATSSAKSRYLQTQYGQLYTPDTSDFTAFNPNANANALLDGFMNMGLGPNPAALQQAQARGGPNINDIMEPQRSVYIGNVPDGASVEELCNVIRGGNLQQIRYLPTKNCAFVTFVECGAAAIFFATASQQGLFFKGNRLRVGWAKEEPALSPALLLAIQSGTTRNVYIGGIKDFDLYTEAKLRADFANYGEIELVNFLKDKSAAFVNFTSISAAQKAIDQIDKSLPEYLAFSIRPGRDRCSHAPKDMSHNRPQSIRPQAMRSTSSGQSQTQGNKPAAAPAPAPAPAVPAATEAKTSLNKGYADAVAASAPAVSQ